MSYHDLNQNPEMLQELLRRARRERAEAMHRLLVLPIKRLLRMEACSKTASSRENASSSRAAVPA
ncbi:MAG TPA: hypothetical protein VFZ84_14465 [Burkholderiales bacterium]